MDYNSWSGWSYRHMWVAVNRKIPMKELSFKKKSERACPLQACNT